MKIETVSGNLVVSFPPADLDALNRLRAQISETRPITIDDLRKTVLASRLFLARDEDKKDAVVGMATLVKYHTLTGWQGRVEDVAVDQGSRGKGVGRSLMNALIKHAKSLDLGALHLTSHPKRAAANGLYESLGFKKRETNVFFLSL